jgi:peroxiredoxin
LGDLVHGLQATARRYGSAESLPDTFLIDQKGRLAATYSGVVDREKVEANIQALLAKR